MEQKVTDIFVKVTISKTVNKIWPHNKFSGSFLVYSRTC
jgi:hypothetical protein